MNKKTINKNLGLVLTYGSSLSKWERDGSLQREIDYYNELSKHVNKIFIFSYASDDKRYGSLFSENIEIIPKPKRISNLLYSFLLPIIHLKTLKDIQIIKTNQVLGSWTAVIIKIIFKAKLYLRSGYTISLSPGKNNPLYALIEKIAYSFCDLSTVTSDFQRKHLINKYKINLNKIKVLPNQINTNLFNSSKTKIQKHNNLKLLYVGRFEKEKNIMLLLDVLKEVRGHDLTIIGSGSYENIIKKTIEKNSLRVRMINNVNNFDLPRYYSNCDLYVQISEYEGNPKTILEAMSCECCCLASNVRGINNIIKHRFNGYLVDLNKISILRGIKELRANKLLRKNLSLNARKTIVNNYEKKVILNKEVDILCAL